MKIDFSNIALILFLLFSLQKANGQELNSISVENKNVTTQSEVVLLINITPSDPNFCGIRIEWGDGEGQDFRYEKPTTEPIKLPKIYDRAGYYTVSVKGKNLSRGLKSAVACKGENLNLSIKVVDMGLENVFSPSKLMPIKATPRRCQSQLLYWPPSRKELGRVSLALAIDSEGKLIAAEINRTSGLYYVDNFALNYVKSCAYNQKIIDNKPVEYIAILQADVTSGEITYYPDSINDKVGEILEVRLREATESRLKQEKEDAEYQVWLLTSEGKKFLAAAAIQMKKEMAERDQKAEIERKSNLPLTLSKLDLNMTYTYYKNNSCRNDKGTQCLNINQYKQMCEWSDRRHEPFLRDLAASNMITPYTRNEKREYHNFISSAGSLERKSNLYSSDGTCRVNFSISGIWKGSNHVRSFSGVVQTFSVSDLGLGTGKRYVYVKFADGLY